MSSKQSRPIDRRAEPRWPASGEVRLRRPGAISGPVVGRLMDIASSGFRARHRELGMSSGQMVDFEFAGASGVARVVWTRIVDGEAETGFRIMPAQSH